MHKVKGKNGAVYVYAWRGGPRIKAPLGTAAFDRELKAALSAKRRPAVTTLADLVEQYQRTPDWIALRPETKRLYGRCLERAVERLGAVSIENLQRHGTRGNLLRWRDEMALEAPATADLVITVLGIVFNWAVDRESMLVNPLAKFKRLKRQTRKDAIWSDDAIEAFLKVASPQMAVALKLALLTGQRQSDLLGMRWSQVSDVILVTQQKTGAEVAIPVEGELAELLASIDRTSVYVLTNSQGRPWEASGFRHGFIRTCRRAGITGLNFHDLRGTYIARQYAAGESISDIAAISGHSERNAEQVIRKNYMPRTANVLRMERKKNRGV